MLPIRRRERRLIAVLQEFVADIECVDIDYVAEEWPDLHATYHKARALLTGIAHDALEEENP